jgi:hypothetical protein
MEDTNKRIEESILDPMSFEIKNNFISPKDQKSMSTKFDTKNIDRSGKPMISNPDIQTAGLFPPLGTPDITPREDLDGNQFKI